MRSVLAWMLVMTAACSGTQPPDPAAPASEPAPLPSDAAPARAETSGSSMDPTPAADVPPAPPPGRSVSCSGDVSLPKGFSTFSSDALASSLGMPGKPVESTMQVATAVGMLPVYTAMFVREPRAYVLSRFEVPEGAIMLSPENMLNMARDGAIANVQGSLLSEEPIACAGFPGRELVVLSKDRSMVSRTRAVIVGSSLYQVMAVVKSGDQDKPEVLAFLDTFRPHMP